MIFSIFRRKIPHLLMKSLLLMMAVQTKHQRLLLYLVTLMLLYLVTLKGY